jgi:hypothetical protein
MRGATAEADQMAPRSMNRMASNTSLRELVARTVILAYCEDTAALEAALQAEGFSPEVQRPSYTATELTYSRTIRCLLNHAQAWKRAATTQGYTLIVEADFVPCRGIGARPPPFDPATSGEAAWAFLYGGGPRIFRVLPQGSLPGHAACPVAYIVSPAVGAMLAAYAKDELVRQGDLTRYSLWDTQFQWHLMGKGATCFVPFRHYGEHGGLPNPEHHGAGTGALGRFAWSKKLGIGGNHHAECLVGPLAFLPWYARGSRGRFHWTRFVARVTGFVRVLTGRVAACQDALTWRERLRVQRIAFHRLLY